MSLLARSGCQKNIRCAYARTVLCEHHVTCAHRTHHYYINTPWIQHESANHLAIPPSQEEPALVVSAVTVESAALQA